jgi:cbb3-type cytochrome oxidase maturation protein
MSLTWSLFLVCFFMGIAAWLVFWWSVRTGQFQEAEVTAAEMLVNADLEGTAPARPSPDEVFRRERVLTQTPDVSHAEEPRG